MQTESAAGVAQLNPAALENFVAAATSGPVVMVNLLKFKDGGADTYMRYGAGTAPLIEEAGGRVLYVGSPAQLLIGSQDWDLVALVEYPTRQAFLDMVGSAAYAEVAGLRDQSLERSVLYATDPIA